MCMGPGQQTRVRGSRKCNAKDFTCQGQSGSVSREHLAKLGQSGEASSAGTPQRSLPTAGSTGFYRMKKAHLAIAVAFLWLRELFKRWGALSTGCAPGRGSLERGSTGERGCSQRPWECRSLWDTDFMSFSSLLTSETAASMGPLLVGFGGPSILLPTGANLQSHQQCTVFPVFVLTNTDYRLYFRQLPF